MRLTACGSVRSRLTPTAQSPALRKAWIFALGQPDARGEQFDGRAAVDGPLEPSRGKSSRVVGSPPVRAIMETPNVVELGDDIEPLAGRQVMARPTVLQAAMPAIGGTVGRQGQSRRMRRSVAARQASARRIGCRPVPGKGGMYEPMTHWPRCRVSRSPRSHRRRNWHCAEPLPPPGACLFVSRLSVIGSSS